MTVYCPPINPADPEAAALALIVGIPVALIDGIPDVAVATLQELTGVLQIEGAFAGLSWADAKPIAVAICWDACNRDDAADFLRNRARNVLAGSDNMPWQDREGAARAFNIAARVLGL